MVCGRCGNTTRELPWAPQLHEVSRTRSLEHGMCDVCAEEPAPRPWIRLLTADPNVLDCIPWGVIRLAPAGEVLDYNLAEQTFSGMAPSQVVGRNFFSEVAPCTAGDFFRGTFREMVLLRTFSRTELDFVFPFKDGDRVVHVAMLFDPGLSVGALVVEHLF